MQANMQNIGAFVSAAYAGNSNSIVAGSTGNGVLVDGPSIDREAYNLPLSVAVIYAILATVASGKTLSMAYSLQHSPDNSTWTDFAPVSNTVILSSGSGQQAVLKQSVDLTGAYRYIRVAYTPTLSATSTDTAVITPVFVLGGEDLLPAL